MAQKNRSQYDLTPYKEFKLMDAVRKIRDEMDFMEQQREAKMKQRVAKEVEFRMTHHGLSTLDSKLGPLEDRVVKLEKRLDLQENVLEQVVDITGKLQEADNGTLSRMEAMMLKTQKQAQFAQGLQQRLFKLEEGALDSGSHRSAPTGPGVQRAKLPCPHCGKELSAKYLKRGDHQKKYCKKAAAATAAKDEEKERIFFITDVRTLDGTPVFCSEEIPGDLQL